MDRLLPGVMLVIGDRNEPVTVTGRWTEGIESISRYGWEQVFHPDDRDRVLATLGTLTVEDEPVVTTVSMFVGENRALRRVTLTAGRDEPGTITVLLIPIPKSEGPDWRSVAEHQMEMVVRTAPDGKVTWANAAYRDFAHHGSSAIGYLFLPSADETTRENLKRHFAGIDHLNPARMIETYVEGSDGEHRWIQWNTKGSVWGEDGRPLEYQSTGRDITEMVEAEERTSEIAARFRLLADHSPDLIGRHHPDGMYVYASESVERILGWSSSDLCTQSIWDFAHPSDLGDLRDAWNRALEENTQVTLEFRMRRIDDTWAWVDTTIQVLVDPAGVPSEVHTVTREVTSRVQALAAARAETFAALGAEQWFRTLFAHIADVIVVVNRNGDIKYASPGLQRYWKGPVPDSVFQMASFIPTSHQKEVAVTWNRWTSQPGEHPPTRFWFKSAQGDHYVEVVANNALDEEGVNAIVLTFHDLTEQAKSANTISSLRAQLGKIAERERRQVAYALHDDTTQALLAARMNLTQIEEVLEGNSEAAAAMTQVRRDLDQAIQSTRRLLSGISTSDAARTGLFEALRTLTSSWEKNWGISTETRFTGDDRNLHPDLADDIYRIVREALNNARKHAFGSLVRVTVDVDDNEVRLEVADDGEGFGELEDERVPPRSADREGGFGLHSIRDRVLVLNGDIRFGTSDLGGALMVVTTPVTAPPSLWRIPGISSGS